MADAVRDGNFVTSVLFKGSDGLAYPLKGDEATGRILVDNTASGTVTSVSVVSANGFAGTVATATTTPAITLSTTITGILKGNGTAISAAVSGTDLKTVGGNTIIGSGDAGTIGVAYGGTGLTSIAGLSLLVANSANTFVALTPAAGQSIRINAGGTAWEAYTPSAGSSGITIGTTTITSGTDTRILYNNAGVVGEYTLTGSGTVVVMATAPTFVTSITTPSVLATANDSGALGASGTAFSDLFLASGAVINFNAGASTITHSLNTLTIGGSGATTLALSTNSLTLTGSIAATGARVTKGWFTDIESTNEPTINGTALSSATLTFSNKTLTAPKFADLGFIADANGNELIIFDTVTSAVNEITLANAATGNNPKLTASGGDANVGFDFQAKGTGTYRLLGTADQAAELRLYEDTTDGTNYTAFKVGTQSADITYTLPADDGDANQVLSTNGSGVLDWVTPTSTPPIVYLACTDFAASGKYSLSGNSPTFGVNGAVVATAGTATSFSQADWSIVQGTGGLVFANSPQFSCCVFFTGAAASTGSQFYGLGRVTVDGSGHTFTVAHIGFKVTTSGGVSSLYATQADGSTETASSALTTLATNDIIELVLKVNSTTSVDYYWRKNGGSLSSATNLTTNMPSTSTAESSARFSSSNNDTANTFTFRVSHASYQR